MSNATKKLVVGTRGSALAVTQTNGVVARLRDCYPHLLIETKTITTTGDQAPDAALTVIGGKGVFVTEIEDALLRGEIDVAVHSLKDLPTEIPDGLRIAAVPEREDPHDVFVVNPEMPIVELNELPAGAVIATSSLRRRAQLLHSIPHIAVVDIRGNVDTRLRKMREQQLHGIVLAAAGLRRLDRFTSECWIIPYEVMLPAPGQGALAIEARCDDARTLELLATLNHEASHICVRAERALLERLQGGCNVPVGALAELLPDATLRVQGVIATPDGNRLVRKELSGRAEEAAALGVTVANALLDDGGREILDSIRQP